MIFVYHLVLDISNFLLYSPDNIYNEQMNKKLFILVNCLLMLIGCSDNMNTETKRSNRPTEERIKNYVWKEHDEPIELLSLKYGINRDTLKHIVLGYLQIQDPKAYMILTSFENERDTIEYENLLNPTKSTTESISLLADKYNIETRELSKVLFDYRLFTKEHKDSGRAW